MDSNPEKASSSSTHSPSGVGQYMENDLNK